MNQRIRVTVEHDDCHERHAVVFERPHVEHDVCQTAHDLCPVGWRFDMDYNLDSEKGELFVRISITNWPHATTRTEQRRVIQKISSDYYKKLASIESNWRDAENDTTLAVVNA